MSPRSSYYAPASFAIVIPLVLTVSARAEDEDPGALMGRARTAMDEGRWEEALALHTLAVTRFGPGAMQAFGPQFGAVYFHKGTCEMKLKRWDEAMRSFETCYRDYPNPPGAGGNRNGFQKLALLKWGEAAMGAKQWDLAIRCFQKFLKERDKTRDEFAAGAFHVGMAVCHYQMGRISEGNESLEIAIHNKAIFPTPESGIIAGFEALVGAAVRTGNERALLDFIGKNRGALVAEPFIMQRFARVFLQLAADAEAADMNRSALELYQLVPAAEIAMDDIRARLKNQPEDAKQLESELAVLEREWRAGDTPETLRLAAIAVLHEKLGNLRGALACWRQLESYWSGSSAREEHLFQWIRVSCLLGEFDGVTEKAELFERTFPLSKRLEELRPLIWNALFSEGDYKTCIDFASPVLEKLPADSPVADACLHLLAASYFHTGAYDKAGPLLQKHAERFPKSGSATATAYYRAATAVRAGSWNEAGALLDAFLTEPADAAAAYLPFALYDRALCHEAANENVRALEILGRLVEGYPDHAIIARARVLEGRILLELGRSGPAEQAFKLACEKAGQDSAVAGEALFHLIDLTASTRPAEAVKHAEAFWKAHSESSVWQARVAVSQTPALVAMKRGGEALARLREWIVKHPADPGIETMVNAYTSAFLHDHGPEELRDHYQKFEGLPPDDKHVVPLLRMAVIDAFEKAAEQGTEARRLELSSVIRQLYQELKTGHVLADLPGFILLKIGDHLRLATSTPRESLAYYDGVLASDDVTCHPRALLGRADVLAASEVPVDLEKAAADFERVAKESPLPADRDYAVERLKEMKAK